MKKPAININWLDRAIGFFNPRAGLSRARARAAASVLLMYEGARTDRRTSGWATLDTAANSEIGPALTWLRRRSRDLVRNNAYAARAMNELVGHGIGTGITAKTRPAEASAGDTPPKAQTKALTQEIDRAWKIWVNECDADGQLDFYGLQRLAARAVIEGGECIVRLRPRKSADGLHVPFQIQVLEGDYLDYGKTQSTDTGWILQGVEFDKLGRRIGYWLYPQHPGEVLIPWISNYLVSQRVDARFVLHIYNKDRAGQIHGVPWLTPVLMALSDLSDYCEAELVRKKIEACFAAFVTQPDGADGPPLAAKERQSEHQQVETFEPGMIRYLSPGADVKFAVPSGSGVGYKDFMTDVQTRIASGVGLTYEQLTGDLSRVNYSSYRAGLLSFRNHMDAFRWLTFIPMFCTPVRNWFIDLAAAAGKIPSMEYGTEWTPPSYGSVDPTKDAEAALADVRTGRMTWDQMVSEQGYDPDEQMEQIKRRNAAWDKAGVIFDCDPRNRSRGGNALGGGGGGGEKSGDKSGEKEPKPDEEPKK